jgi:hypothetical protein
MRNLDLFGKSVESPFSFLWEWLGTAACRNELKKSRLGRILTKISWDDVQCTLKATSLMSPWLEAGPGRGDMTWSITCAFVPDRFLYLWITEDPASLSGFSKKFGFQLVSNMNLLFFVAPKLGKQLCWQKHICTCKRLFEPFLGVLYSQDPFIGSPNSAGPSRFISRNWYPFCLYRACFRCVYSFCPHLTRAEHFWGG